MKMGSPVRTDGDTESDLTILRVDGRLVYMIPSTARPGCYVGISTEDNGYMLSSATGKWHKAHDNMPDAFYWPTAESIREDVLKLAGKVKEEAVPESFGRFAKALRDEIHDAGCWAPDFIVKAVVKHAHLLKPVQNSLAAEKAENELQAAYQQIIELERQVTLSAMRQEELVELVERWRKESSECTRTQ